MINLLLKNYSMVGIQPKYSAKIHWISFLMPYIFIALGSIGFLAVLIPVDAIRVLSIGLIILFFKGLINLLKYKAIKIDLSENYLSLTTGLFSKTISDISLNKMEAFQLHQSYLGKHLNFGTLTVTTGEITHSYRIADPLSLREKLLNNIKY
ncbi:MAG TPA: hypothetical protein DD740_07910 [Chryseobacterium sp.]|nr:PH domain-containing protein [Chryseobacterium sp. NEB161]HBR12118.1 hypothetical protein [Chryseobacterium sp.]